MQNSKFFEIFSHPRPLASSKWSAYFEAYEKEFSKFIGKSPTVVEIGVSKGGSLSFWKEVFGHNSKIIGIDINPQCASHSNPQENIYVEIGNARDESVIKEIIEKHGKPDIVIDDGDHNSRAMKTSLKHFWPHLKNHGVYAIEDIHGVFWQDQNNWDISIFEHLYSLIFGLNAKGSRGHSIPTEFSHSLHSITCYWSLFFLEKRAHIKSPIAIESKNGTITAITKAE